MHRRTVLSIGLTWFARAADGFVTTPGARIWYRDSGGDGVPIVLLHAASGNSSLWDYQFTAFYRAGYRVIAFDRRGHGRTEIQDSPVAVSRSAADDLLSVADALGLDRFHLLGTAAGGIVALDFLLSFPQRLRALVVANSVYGIEDPEYVELRNRSRTAEAARSGLGTDFWELSPAYRAMNPEGVARWKSLSEPRPVSLRQPRPSRATFAALARITAPSLLITGDADLYTPPPVMRWVADRIPLAETAVIAESGHSSFWEQPERFNETVLRFLSKHRAR